MPTSSQTTDDPADILLIEDNPGDIRLVKEAIKATGSETRIQTSTTGDAAIEFLMEHASETNYPDIVLLDLNLPGRDGCAVLDEIRDHSRLKRLPVLVLTSSQAEEDIVRCYDAKANAYLTKPSNTAALFELMEQVEQFWIDQVRLPPLSS